jgi:mRNA-degrading endonuclease RelE of RelBE toxin-antitoxin system
VRIDDYCEVKYLPEFNKDMKKLCKRYRTLEGDLKNFLNIQIILYHIQGVDNKGVVQISGLGIEEPKIYKAIKFACRSLAGTGGRSGIRLTYAYDEIKNDKDKITLIEIYYKGDKENENRDRIYKHFG